MRIERIEPVTPDRWDDLVELFGDNGAYANCWCIWWRVSAAAFDRMDKRPAMAALVADGAEPGLLAYADGGRPVGWVSVAPREEFGRVLRSPILKPVDDDGPVWSVVCFYIPRAGRGQGVGHALLGGAVDHARTRGASIVEGYPVDPGRKSYDAAGVYTGTVPMFEKAGFVEVVRRRPDSRVIMRKAVAPDS